MQTRYFNNISIDPSGLKILKSAEPVKYLDDNYDLKFQKPNTSAEEKIYYEYLWFKSIAKIPSLRKYVPHEVDYSPSKGLSMTYYPEGDLGSRLVKITSTFEVVEILDKLFEIAAEFWGIPYPSQDPALRGTQAPPDYRAMYLDHSRKRYEESSNLLPAALFRAKEIPFSKIERAILDLGLLTNPICIIHGDFFPSNILINEDSFILIDPRGKFPDRPTFLGDPYYDLAKLRHSFIGGYDFIIRGAYDPSLSIPAASKNIHFSYDVDLLTRYFDKKVTELGFDIYKVKFIEGLLFLNMIPCHAESPARMLMFYSLAREKLRDFISL